MVTILSSLVSATLMLGTNSINGVYFYTNPVSHIYCGTTMVWSAAAPAPTPVVHWKMNDNDVNNTVTDSEGNLNAAMIDPFDPDTETASHSIAGKINNAFSFDGSTYVHASDTALTQFGTADYSVAFWFRPQSETANQFVLLKNAAFGFYWRGIGNSLWIYDNGWGAATSNTTWNLNQWYHIVSVREGSANRVYVNGALDGTGSCAEHLVGGYEITFPDPWRTWWTGDMDDLRIYNEAISGTEVLRLYNSGNGTED